MYRTVAIILKKNDWQESSQQFIFYTKNFGKINALGRGTKKIESKLNSSLQFFCLLDLTFAKGKNFDHITGVEIVKDFKNIKMDYKKIIYTCYGLELVEKLSAFYNPEREVFDLLLDFFEFVNQPQPKIADNLNLVKNRFERKLLEIIGYQAPENISLNKQKFNIFLENYLQKDLKTKNFFKPV
ncbi:MAG: DNA repair protein RecO [Candidatus Buchananbacteria bacterium]|nr:DNA repair protein RecO [Candidatus Buchananbacteria bacterium]